MALRPSPLMRSLVANLPPLVDGRVPVPDGPGLGIELDPEIEWVIETPADLELEGGMVLRGEEGIGKH